MIIEFHILQSFPVSCLNRDDTGSPKSCVIGGVTRARVSSQAWKRAVRLQMHDLGVKLGLRTKKIVETLAGKLVSRGCEESKAIACAQVVGGQLSDDSLIFLSDSEYTELAQLIEKKNCDAEVLQKEAEKLKKQKKEPKMFKKVSLATVQDGLDIGLFGRMVAKAPSMNIEAAASFSHAFSTHEVIQDLDFFTALDDCEIGSKSSHMGTTEFTSATYYRYISLNVEQLKETLGIESDEDLSYAVSSFIKALYLAVPGARQATMSASCLWDYAQVLVRNGQRMQCSFDKPIVSGRVSGYLTPSIKALEEQLTVQEKQAGSLYGLKKRVVFSDETSIDEVIDQVMEAIEK